MIRRLVHLATYPLTFAGGFGAGATVAELSHRAMADPGTTIWPWAKAVVVAAILATIVLAAAIRLRERKAATR